MSVMGEACEYCDGPPDEELKRRGRVETVCTPCREELERADEVDREQAAYEDACDRSLSEWKDEGKVGWPRPVVRRGR